MVKEPGSEEELFHRAHALCGQNLGELAKAHGIPVPKNLLRKKGWVGELLEVALGASAKSRPIPDFAHLGIELKSIPVDGQGRPQETTFVCSLDRERFGLGGWSQSRVREKLARVLFVPVQMVAEIPLAQRQIGHPLLWSPSQEEEDLLRADWDDFAELIAADLIDGINARRGRALQIRPKAKNAAARRPMNDAAGEEFFTLPRGFYLRRSFTEAILRRGLAVAF
jgi:DNA mismatch repair protein MutH